MRSLIITLAALGLALATGCSSSTTNNAPAPRDSGTPATDGGTTDPGSDASTAGGDAGPCVQGGSNPLTACSPQTAHCIPFDDTRVPYQNGQVPQVP